MLMVTRMHLAVLHGYRQRNACATLCSLGVRWCTGSSWALSLRITVSVAVSTLYMCCIVCLYYDDTIAFITGAWAACDQQLVFFGYAVSAAAAAASSVVLPRVYEAAARITSITHC